jgi:hypothetical protein
MSKKAWIFLGLVCIGFGVVIAALVSKLIENRPEQGMAQTFLLSNQEVAERFGVPITATYTSEGSSVEYHPGKMAGKYRFEIGGSISSGVLRVQWTSDGEHGFRVETIDLLNPPEVPERIWQESER